MTSSGVISNRITKIKILNSSKFFFFYKTWCKITKKIVSVPFWRIQGFYERKNLKILKFCQKCFWNKILLDLSDRAHFFLQMVNMHKLIKGLTGLAQNVQSNSQGQMRGGPNRPPINITVKCMLRMVGRNVKQNTSCCSLRIFVST